MVNVGKKGDNGQGFQLIILPYIEASAIDSTITQKIRAQAQTKPDDPFDSYDMAALFKGPISLYGCPTDDDLSAQLANEKTSGYQGSSYAGVMGSYHGRKAVRDNVEDPPCSPSNLGGADDCARTGNHSGAINFDGLLTQDLPIKIKTATDGMSNTLMIGERWYQLRAWTVGGYWTQDPPGADPWGGGGGPKKPTGPHPGSYIFSCKNVDHRFAINADINVVGCQSTHEPGEHRPTSAPCPDPKKMPVNSSMWGSFHPTGANFAMGDGSVRFLSDTIARNAFLAMASRNGDDIVAEQ
jgi:prepilin-type processing-associated H-X9-DG protein